MNLNRLGRHFFAREPRTRDTTPTPASQPMELDEFLAHLDRLDASSNPTKGLWGKRNTPSGAFEAIKRSGDVFKGVKREN